MANQSQFEADVDKAYDKKVVQTFLAFEKAVIMTAGAMLARDTRDTGVSGKYAAATGGDVVGSPVWSGSFRAGHNLSLDAPDFTPPPVSPEIAEGLRWPEEPERILNAKPMSEYAQKLIPLRPFGVAYFTNAADYARKLENRYSPKAPDGVMRVVAAATVQQYKNAAFRIAAIGGKK